MEGSYMKELLEKRAKLIADARALLENKKEGFGPEEDAKFEAMMKEADDLKTQADRIKKINDLQADLEKPNEKVDYSGMAGTGQSNIKALRGSREYGDAFWNVLRYDRPISQYKNVLSEGTSTSGGYLLPTEFEYKLVESLLAENVMRKLCSVMTTSNDREIPIESSFGVANWALESAAIAESDSTFGQIVMKAYKLARLTKVSDELMQDSAFDMSAYLAGAFGKSFGRAEESAMVNGDGVNKPTGITSTTTTVALASATAITSDEVLGIYHGLKQPYRPFGVWLMNDSTLLAVRKLKDGSGAYYFVPAMTAGMPDTFLGKPVYTSEFMPTMTTGAKSILFGDFKYYRIADRQTRTLQRLNELYAANGQVGFIGRERVDGKLLLNEAVVAGLQA